jgi:hypothetical protein
MYFWHEDCLEPENKNVKIWRYLDFTKFVDLLNSNALFFTRLDKLDDLFEGSLPLFNRLIKEHIVADGSFTEEQKESILRGHKDTRKSIVVNCWYMNAVESAAMWKLYLKSDEGVAIQSTYNKLKECFNATKTAVFLGLVKYIDYKKDFILDTSPYYTTFHKRKSFEHENELRAMCFLPSSDPDSTKDVSDVGIHIPADIDILIENIYVSPTAPEWLSELVKSVIEKYDLKKKVIQSSLSDEPVF